MVYLAYFDSETLVEIFNNLLDFDDFDKQDQSCIGVTSIENLVKSGDKFLASKIAEAFKKKNIKLCLSLSRNKFYPQLLKYCHDVTFYAEGKKGFAKYIFENLLNVKNLIVRDSSQIGNCLEILSSIPKLKSLTIDRYFGFNKHFGSDIVIPTLKYLDIEICTGIPYFGFAPNLIKLKIYFYRNMNDNNSVYVFNLPKLKHLTIDGVYEHRGMIILSNMLETFKLNAKMILDLQYMACFKRLFKLEINNRAMVMNDDQQKIFVNELISTNTNFLKILRLQCFKGILTKRIGEFINLTSLSLILSQIDLQYISKLLLNNLKLCSCEIENIELLKKFQTLETLILTDVRSNYNNSEDHLEIELPPNLKNLTYQEPWMHVIDPDEDVNKNLFLQIGTNIYFSAEKLLSLEQVFYGSEQTTKIFLRELKVLLGSNRVRNLKKISLYCDTNIFKPSINRTDLDLKNVLGDIILELNHIDTFSPYDM
jgi:hypothetical protein